MLKKIKTFTIRQKPRKKQASNALEYIEEYWKNLVRFQPKDSGDILGLPHPYLIPAPAKEGGEFYFEEFFYWDSFFMLQAFTAKDHKKLFVGIVDNMTYLITQHGKVPNANNKNMLGRSQPPFLTTLAWQAYETFGLSKVWLKKTMAAAEKEYKNVWMGTTKPNARKVYNGLSRTYDVNYIHDLAETETGWDMTPRFNRESLAHLPVDINALLYKYEKDFQRYYKLLKKPKIARKWQRAAKKRKDTMTELMWNEQKGLFYDYNYVKGHQSGVSSLASYYTMWAGLASKHQAEKMVKQLKRFEKKGGLTATQGTSLSQLYPKAPPMQWAHPNGWAPLHFLVVEGLEKYHYKKHAKRIALKWIRTNLHVFEEKGVFREKYNVVHTNKRPKKGLYPDQEGFGWTNAVFSVFCKKYV